MTKKEKREEKIRVNPANVSLDDFEALIKQHGYIKEGGKHPQAVVGSQSKVLPYKRENPIKPSYVKQLLHLIDSQK